MPDVRKSAFEVISRVLYDDAYSALVLNSKIKEQNLDRTDAGFLSCLVYGVLERKILLDHIITEYSSTKFRNIEKKTLVILEMGIFQILFMDKVPDNASVNESVKLTKKVGASRSSGFVNAVLRNFIRNNYYYSLPDKSDTVKFLSVKYSCPEHITKLWLKQYGEYVTEKILEGLSGRPPLTIRVNTLKTTKAELIDHLTDRGVSCNDVPFLPNAVNIENSGSIEKSPEFKDGMFYVQDSASQLCCEILNAKENTVLCDVCSAPGGKSIYSAIKMNNIGKIYSYDLYDHKIKLITESAKRLGIDIINAKVRDASAADDSLPDCDRLLCDVPCSGLGIIRRKPEIRYKKETIIDNLPNLQYSILCNSSASVSIGGVLVYSTCTLNDKENADIVNKFLIEHDNFAADAITLPDGISRVIDEPEHMLTLLPFNGSTDGFFISRLRRIR